MRKSITDWKLAYAPNIEAKAFEITRSSDLDKYNLKTINASVPGNFELDFMREGLLEDLYYSTNVLNAQKLENLHLWYFAELELEETDCCLHFGGIDTIADIYINGELCLSVDNMFTEYDVYGNFVKGKNEVLVHIKPACIETRKYILPVAASAFKYSYSGLYVRKAPHMFGWDIMPRIVSGGIWKKAEIRKIKGEGLREVFISTTEISDDLSRASLKLFVAFDAELDDMSGYSVRICGRCGEHSFEAAERVWHNSFQFEFDVENPRLWWPKNAGEPSLYEVTVELLHNNTVIDFEKLNTGIRTVKLNYTDGTDEAGNGEFCFEINNKKVFVLGTNWVPLDAFHSRDAERLPKALELLDDIGCNMIRLWGGNVYESDELYDFCDRRGIMVWQDFAMGCAVYPQERAFYDKIEEEAVFQIKRLRNHTSLVLWAGDNEGDLAVDWVKRVQNDPNDNYITRSVLKTAVMSHDTSRPYLPSSPYVSEKAYREKLRLPEDHLWGPRDYFKGEFYGTSVCHFASEIGYHGFPSVQSLKKFLKAPEKIFDDRGIPTDEYLLHSSSMELEADAPYAYRIRLAYEQVVTLFGGAEEAIDDFVMQSQISQAEAKKYFIERFRMSKWRRTGIIWWNLLDGWPQVSDAVVDYYFEKKLAYDYIKRSQQPICFMCDEPENGYIRLFGVNDLPYAAETEYRVTRISDRTETGVSYKKEVLKGVITLSADSAEEIGKLSVKENEKELYLIEWKADGRSGKNHYFTNIAGVAYRKYISAMKNAGLMR